MIFNAKRALVTLQSTVAHALVRQGLSSRQPLLVAVGWRVAMHPSLRLKARLFGRKKLVVLAKSGGVEDIEAAYAEQGARYSVLFLPRSVVKESGRFFLGDAVSDNDYRFDDAALENLKVAYRHHLSRVLNWFKRLFGVTAFVQFNLLYWAERELAEACVGERVAFITVHKESNWSPQEIDSRRSFLKSSAGSFGGTAIAVYNEVMGEIFTSAGVVKPEHLHVPGCARLDQSHQLRSNMSEPTKQTVLFFLIEKKAGLGRVRDPQSDNWMRRGAAGTDGYFDGWTEMSNKVNRAVLRLASENPEILFICKGKTGFGQEQIQALAKSVSDSALPGNVALITDGVGHHLLRKAAVVIGFNTTAVLEAMAAGVPVIVPNIFSPQEKENAGFSHDVNDGALVPTSETELRSMVLDAVEAKLKFPELTLGQKHALDRMMGNSDGKSGQRLRNLLDRAVAGDLD